MLLPSFFFCWRDANRAEFLPDRTDVLKQIIMKIPLIFGGPGCSVGIATDYGMDGPGSNRGGDEIFRPSRPSLGSTQSPVQLVLGLSRGYRRPRRGTDPPPPPSSAEGPRKE